VYLVAEEPQHIIYQLYSLFASKLYNINTGFCHPSVALSVMVTDCLLFIIIVMFQLNIWNCSQSNTLKTARVTLSVTAVIYYSRHLTHYSHLHIHL